jgi:transposase
VLVREECRDLMAQITETTARIEAKTKKIMKWAEKTDTARQLQTMLGIGPMTAHAIEAFAPEMSNARTGTASSHRGSLQAQPWL